MDKKIGGNKMTTVNFKIPEEMDKKELFSLSGDALREKIEEIRKNIGCTGCIDCKDCIDCEYCTGCIRCIECTNCTTCIDCVACTSCINCIGCTNMSDKQFCVLNVQLSEDEFCEVFNKLQKKLLT